MSEYQYYEFRAIDRSLDERAMGELRAITSRAEITPTSLINVYHYGDFKGNPDRLMDKYFDAFVYVANWGTHRFMFRLPQGFLDPAAAKPYTVPDVLRVRATPTHVVLDFHSQIEPEGWEEGEEWLDSLVSLRSDLLAGPEATEAETPPGPSSGPVEEAGRWRVAVPGGSAGVPKAAGRPLAGRAALAMRWLHGAVALATRNAHGSTRQSTTLRVHDRFLTVIDRVKKSRPALVLTSAEPRAPGPPRRPGIPSSRRAPAQIFRKMRRRYSQYRISQKTSSVAAPVRSGS